MKNAKLSTVRHLWLFIKENGKWGLLPMLTILVLFGLVLVFAQGSLIAPFIYTLF